MKFYYTPCLSSNKVYYSLYTSILLLLLSFYFIYSKKGTPFLRTLLFLVGFISTIHHCRTFDDEYRDVFRILDMFFANLLGLYILYLYRNRTTFIILLAISLLFLYIQLKCKSLKLQSLLHSFIHIFVAIVLLSNNL
jgi:hypothetical protein